MKCEKCGKDIKKGDTVCCHRILTGSYFGSFGRFLITCSRCSRYLIGSYESKGYKLQVHTKS